jgi:hypothetical protein
MINLLTYFTIHKFKISKIIKNQEKYYKKLENILSVLVKKVFKICIIWLVKIQILSNFTKGTHMTWMLEGWELIF